MYQGFYELTSGMITQQRNLNTISNNMANIETIGYKSDKMTMSTFDEQMLLRTGRVAKRNNTQLGTQTPIVKADQTYTDYSQGSPQETDGKYDFCISGDGFFSVRTNSGVQYTRNGAFSVSDNGTLMLDNIGPVLGADGNTITIDNENFTVSEDGRIYSETGRLLGQLRVTTFDTATLHKEDNGMYTTTTDGGTDATGQTDILYGYLETSNVDMIDEMTDMISAERAYQGAAQMLKMYDNVLDQASNTVGRIV
jgi:flagellar basal-body rod protein FlgG